MGDSINQIDQANSPARGNVDPLRPWTGDPPRSGRSIFRSHCNKGTFVVPVKMSFTTPVNTRALARLVEGAPVREDGEKLVPAAHRPSSIPVRPSWYTPQDTKMRGRYPRSGTPNSLAYRNPWERVGAHAGWGEQVSTSLSAQAHDLETAGTSAEASSLATPRLQY